MRLSDAARSAIVRLAGQFPQPRSALLGALFVAQEEAGALHPEVVAEVAALLGLPASEAAAVASFYHLYRFRPEGRHLIQVCTNVSCLLNGCRAVLDDLRRRLGIQVGETTPDGRFTLKTAECLAACEAAPVVMVGPDRHGPLRPEQIGEILERYA
ncbi:MAG: NADH-quinone oxidoreductase subunit NuoE [Armatimonadota bacterium]|nr:NADH-quinone oxidoreductase subunit NuoE [Armatimonadota bacterium]MDR7451861.1 NADH-quinone oxidoreductase subunit NuoE [Armatimonadota bacterium]MDR7467586.1 NADH-quinone oxidoreductase subunit NuoE [Armatimonadota bacterium]MDR7494453.1 NADH-quinone oxidoreductase subunit NuoE [Armatimonadota bacterium]MDR7499714.1 NADH-quinone oxidoreductase subunit NuoE [Armatimonadota bacterium]